MTGPLSDTGLIVLLWDAAGELQTRASRDAEQADDLDVRHYLQQFADQLSDAMADSLWPAKTELERNDRLRDTDPKARREFMPVEPATGGAAP